MVTARSPFLFSSASAKSNWGTEQNHRPEIVPHNADTDDPESTIEPVPRLPTDPPPNSTVVLTNPDKNCSPAAFRGFLYELNKPEPEPDSLNAAETLRELRMAGEA